MGNATFYKNFNLRASSEFANTLEKQVLICPVYKNSQVHNWKKVKTV